MIASRASSFTRPQPLFHYFHPLSPPRPSRVTIICQKTVEGERRRRFSFSIPLPLISSSPLLTSLCENTNYPTIKRFLTSHLKHGYCGKKEVRNPCQIQNKGTCYFCNKTFDHFSRKRGKGSEARGCVTLAEQAEHGSWFACRCICRMAKTFVK